MPVVEADRIKTRKQSHQWSKEKLSILNSLLKRASQLRKKCLIRKVSDGLIVDPCVTAGLALVRYLHNRNK